MSNKTKNVALAMAGLASVFAVGQTVANAATYTVQNGDTLSEIASKFNVSIDDLVSKNNITNKNLIFTNQKIEVSNDDVKSTVMTKSSSQADAHAAAATAAKSVAKPAAKAVAVEPVQAKETTETKDADTEVKAPVAKPAKVDMPEKVEAAAPEKVETAKPVAAKAAPASGSTHDQFIANGGTEAMWQTIVQPESGGNPNAVSSNGYQGLGQTKEAWGTGSVAEQTKGMVNYASSRYGSVESAIAFRQANGWW